jgi:hypothetical protein
MPYMKKVNGKSVRDYTKQYEKYDGRDDVKKDRAKRNAARKKLGLEVGDPREAGHKKALSKGGSNDKSNLKPQSRSSNRSFKRKKDGSMK